MIKAVEQQDAEERTLVERQELLRWDCIHKLHSYIMVASGFNRKSLTSHFLRDANG